MTSSGGQLRLQILGPLRIWRDGVELDAGPRQQAYLLAVLLARAGEPVSTSELVDLIWDQDVPPSAVNILQKYVGALRRLLEPALPARGTGSYLQRRGNGYLFTPGPGTLDVLTFRESVEAARAGSSAQRPDVALDCYVRALDLWHASAGDGLLHGPSSVPVFAALDAELYLACVAATTVAISLGQPERVLRPLRLAARMAPLHETVQASLVSALAAAGRQAEALAVFQAVRARLVEELGLDPGPDLLAAHRRVLDPAPAETTPLRRPSVLGGGTPPDGRLVGRVEELAVLRQAVESALAGGTGLVVVEGEPGVGKTRLLEEAGAEADRRGALVVWGRCLEGDGTPSMWPWTQAIGALLSCLPVAARKEWQAGELGRLLGPNGNVPATPVMPDSGARFRLLEQAVALVRRVSAWRPVVLVVDDLQWADAASLELFSHLAAHLPHGTSLTGVLRDRAPVPGSELERMLAATSRLPRHRRIRLGPLGPAEVAELVRQETGQDPGPGATRSIHARTAGNPFFVRELSRLLADRSVLTEAATTPTGVPSTVRDVVRDRIAKLDEEVVRLLQTAALIGRDIDLALLARCADLSVQTCLDRIEPLQELGLLEFSLRDPYAFRFAHDLVRESVVGATPPPRATRLHVRVADALEQHATTDDERLAHHLWAAGPLADPARTAAALIRAGRCAAGKSAFEAAAQQLGSAAQVARRAGLAELELSALSLFTAVDGMRAGYVGAALELLERAEHLARALGRERETADFLFSRWAAHSQGIQLDRAGVLAQRLLEQGETSADPVVRTYGWHAWGIHQWDIGNIGEAFRYLSRSRSTMLDDLAHGGEDTLRRDLRLLGPAMLALMTGLHGDTDTARMLFDTIETTADGDAYVLTVWAAFACTAAALAGDPVQALRTAERGSALDPEFSFVFLGSYQRLARCWAHAVTGADPAGAAAEAQRLITTALADPPRSGLATWYGLLAEMWLAADRLDEATASLDQAESALDTHGQRYAEGFLLLLRARLMEARGESVAAVRAAAERARALSAEREAHLFARRAEEFLAGPADT